MKHCTSKSRTIWDLTKIGKDIRRPLFSFTYDQYPLIFPEKGEKNDLSHSNFMEKMLNFPKHVFSQCFYPLHQSGVINHRNVWRVVILALDQPLVGI